MSVALSLLSRSVIIILFLVEQTISYTNTYKTCYSSLETIIKIVTIKDNEPKFGLANPHIRNHLQPPFDNPNF